MCHKELCKGKANLFMVTLKSLAVMLIVTEIFKADAQTSEQLNLKEVEYTHCKESSPVRKECAKQVSATGRECQCTVKFTLERAMPGPVTLYYRLPNFNQTSASYANSLDKEQLRGNLSMNVSSDCGDFSYGADKRPIAPCGEIADSYFFDEFILFPSTDTDNKVPDIGTGLDGVQEEKKNYANPPGDLKTAFKNFSTPKSWPIHVTDLDKADPNDNAFQNERFIAWMKTDLSTKPAMRFYNTGMPGDGLAAGNYSLRIRYYPSKYITGPRKVIISSDRLATKELEEAKRIATTPSTHTSTKWTNVPTNSGRTRTPKAGPVGPGTQTTSGLDTTTLTISTPDYDMPLWALVVMYTAVSIFFSSILISYVVAKFKIKNLSMFIW